MKKLFVLLALSLLAFRSADRPHPGPVDEAYTAKIREYTMLAADRVSQLRPAHDLSEVSELFASMMIRAH